MSDVVLICNPRAGGRWKELAEILDSDEARGVKRIVTDSIDDLAGALHAVTEHARLLCIYGGDGTIQHVLNHLIAGHKGPYPHVAFIGGGTMNVAARTCGMRGSPSANFRATIRDHASGRLMFREMPLLRVRQAEETRYGFTFGMGPLVRLLDRFEHGPKSKAGAAALAARSMVTVLTKRPRGPWAMLEEMPASVAVEGRPLPFDRFVLVFCNVTGSLNPGVRPFIAPRAQGCFHFAAYAIGGRELVTLLPLLARGWLPIDRKALLRPISTWRHVLASEVGRGSFPVDPRYVNTSASHVEIESSEALFTIDGEILRSTGAPIAVDLGPSLMLALRS